DGGTYGSITLSGNGTCALSAATTGTYAGILIFQDRNNAKALTLSGNAMQGISGTIYAPAAQVAESGNAQVGSSSNPIALVVDTLSMSGNAVAQLSAANDATAYTPAQIRTAYGINDLSLDGTGQTIAIVDAYDDPQIYQALDAFDGQFGLTTSGPTLYQQYGPATSFLTVLNQSGQATSLPGTDPVGQGGDNWEVEESLDVEWAHAIAPGAKIILVEANSQSLSDLMTAAATAASQPGVSTVSMRWGFAEGQGVSAAQEAAYDQTFAVPGVTFVASTGDYGAADPVYPAFSPNVLAVGGTSLTLNADNSYNSETGWGYYSSSVGSFIGSGGGLSQYEAEPAYQAGVQSTGSRTTPDVSFVADPATGVWIADTYNLDPSNPWEVVGGTSLSAPAWAGLVALVNQGRSAAGRAVLNSSSPTETQQSLYSLSQNDYQVITSGSNGYSAAAGYNLVTGLGTPVANLLVPDLIAGNFPATGLVPPASASALVNSGTTGANAIGSGNVMNVFDALTMTGSTESSSPKDVLAQVTSERISKAHDAVLQRQDLATSQNELAWLWGWTGFQEQRHSSVVADGFASAVDKVLELS
ncbi:MAG: S53 family peptidase, partial [Thermoguttaceae bacterium]